MSEELLNVLLLIASVGSLISYLPQLWKLIHIRSRAEELSLITSCLWVYGSGITALYAVMQTDDIGMIVSALVNHVGCVAMLALTLFHRYIKVPLLNAEGMSVADILQRRRNRQHSMPVSLTRGHPMEAGSMGAGPMPQGAAMAKARPTP